MVKSDSMEVNLRFPVSGRKEELEHKQRILQEFLAMHSLDALLVSRHENIAWVTAGLVDMRVGILREVAVGSLLFTRDGRSYYLTTNNEALRLAQEEFAYLDYQPVIRPWYASDVQASIKTIIGSGKVASDDATNGIPTISMKSLRLPLTDGEIDRYRWLGQHIAEAVTDTLLILRPGITESAMQAMAAERLLAQSILPSVFLTATDNRIRNYRHAVPREGVLQRFAMLNICARRWGLSASITRFVHFGTMPTELIENFSTVTNVNASLLHATREGVTADALFTVAQRAYLELGHSGEEQLHHQGGATGYWEREWVARPGGTERVLHQQAMAWNASLNGAKTEDTVVLCHGEIETLTCTPRLPVVATNISGCVYRSAGVLLDGQ